MAPHRTVKHMEMNLAESCRVAMTFFPFMRRIQSASSSVPNAPMPPPSVAVNTPP